MAQNRRIGWRWVAVFGEIGLTVTRLRTTADFGVRSTSRGSLIRTRSGLGLSIYF